MISITKQLIKKLNIYLIAFIRWLFIGIIIGLLCGGVGALFAKSIEFVTQVRTSYPNIILFLPLLGIISILVYKLLCVSDVNTNDIFESVRSSKRVRILLAPAVFIGSVLTHLGGGSAGREGAALQIGGSISSLVAKIFKLNDKTRHIVIMCGMAALFSSVFGTPIGACVFAIEVVSVGTICSAAFFPGIIASMTSYLLSHALGTAAETFDIGKLPKTDVTSLLKVIALAGACAFVGAFFCKFLHSFEKLFGKLFKNKFVRMAVASSLIVILTAIVGSQTYNGGGLDIVMGIFEGDSVGFEMFLLKILFTALTVTAGLKGGEIIPVFFIGATLGCAISPYIGLSAAFCAAIGMAALFCSVTNCPFATIFLCCEMFGSESIMFVALAVSVSFLLSGKTSLYSSQKFIYSKINEEIITTEGE